MKRGRAGRKAEAKRRLAVGDVTVHVQVRRAWAVNLAVVVARSPVPARPKAWLAGLLLRIPQYRVGSGPWAPLRFRVVP